MVCFSGKIGKVPNNVKNINKMPPLRGTKEVKSSDALRRAKAIYYQKKKNDESYMK